MSLGRAVVITCSTRAASGVYPDRAGPLIVEALQAWGFAAEPPVVVPDGPPVGEALRTAIASGAAVVVTTGGTGLSPTDATPEQTAPLFDRLRAAGTRAGVPTAILSRGLAGLAGHTLVVNLPGSPGGVRDALAILAEVVPHAVDQVAGGDHRR